MEAAAEADPDTSAGSSNLFEEELVRGESRTTTDGVENVARPSEEIDVLEEYEVPADLVSVGSEPPEDVPQEQGAAMFINQPTINMEIDLARVQQPSSFMSPVVVLNNSLMVEPVPEVQATIEILEDNSERGEGDEGSSVAVSAATTAAMMESPIVLIEDTLRMGTHGQDPQAGPSTQRNQADTPRSRKRRRIPTPQKPATPSPSKAADFQCEDDDDGTICSICLDSWTSTGEHRLVSLKCGHLFGYMCIKRWLQDNPVQSRCCATCKTKAHLRDIRHLFAKGVKAVDNSEEMKLRHQLEEEKLRVSKLAVELQVASMELELQRTLANELRLKLKDYEQRTGLRTNASLIGEVTNIAKTARNYKIALDRTMELCREPGCRVMAYGNRRHHLLISQKSTQNLFPGYSIKFIDIPAFQHSSVLHISGKMIRDISIDVEDELFTAATSERSVKLFSFNNRSVVTFMPSDVNVWSCAFDRERSKFLYLGTQSGTAYVYDIRNCSRYVEEFRTEGDCSPIINICPVSPNSSIPFGGFLVCKLSSCWFFEYTAAQSVESTRLNVDGPFTAMNYSEKTGNIMLTTRPSSRHSRARYILAYLVKLDSICALHIVHTIVGSLVEPNMVRSAQISLDKNNTVMAAYLQDDRQLATWSTGKGNERLQSLPVADVLWDLCPIYVSNQIFLAALSDSKCRVYRAYSE